MAVYMKKLVFAFVSMYVGAGAATIHPGRKRSWLGLGSELSGI